MTLEETVAEYPSSCSTSTSGITTNGQQQQIGGGVEKQYHYAQVVNDFLTCPICSDGLIDPMTHASCRSTFCSKCIEKVGNCPKCSEVDFKKNCLPSPKTIQNMLDKLHVKCGLCKNIVLRGELQDHTDKYCTVHTAHKQDDELRTKVEDLHQIVAQLKKEQIELMKSMLIDKEQSIKEARELLNLKERELILKFNAKEEELEKKMKEKFEMMNPNKPIKLNVRGKIMMTVLFHDCIHNGREPDNIFKEMFTTGGENPLYTDSQYFIDCKPKVFEHIIEWLQFGRLATELSTDMKNSILDSCKMFKLNNLARKIEESNKVLPQKMKLSQLDFINLINLSTNQTLNLSGLDLRGLVLQYTNLEKCHVISSDLGGMNLTQANFKGSILRGCDFSDCDLTNVDFSGCDLSECDFSNAKLNQTKFHSCKFENTKGLNGNRLISLDFSKSTYVECSLKGSDLSHSNFSNTTLSNCNLEQTILKKSNFDNSQFKIVKFGTDCIFEETILRGSSLNRVTGLINVNNVDFSNCKLDNSYITVNSIIKSNLSNSNFRVLLNNNSAKIVVDCNVSGCILSNLDFTGFQFKNVNFTNSILDGSNFANVTFNKCAIKSHFKKNNLKDCTLIDCNWNGSTFEEIDWNDIKGLLLKTSFNDCTFKNCNLLLLKDLSKFKGNKFDGCSFDFEQFTNKSIENIHFQNVEIKYQTMIKFDLKNVQYQNYKFVDSKALLTPLIPSSAIVAGKEFIEIFYDMIYHTNSKSPPQLLYRGTRDGFKGEDFHSRCDNQGPTLTIIKSAEHNQIFGGFTTQSWKSPSAREYISDSSAFIFKIENNGNVQFRKFNILQHRNSYAIGARTNFLPTFGTGHDFHICSECNSKSNSYSNFGLSYELPPPSNDHDEFTYGSEQAKNYLAGSYKFKVSEIEVFKIIQ